MKTFAILFSHEIKMLCRSRLQIAAIMLFIAMGIYSIYYGKAEINTQQRKIQMVTDSVKHAQETYAAALHGDTSSRQGLLRYETAAFPSLVRFNYTFTASNPPAPLAALSLGQRDLYPYYYLLNAQSLYVQTLKGDIHNPFRLSGGNFDLAFVCIYLLPLLIIALGFDVLSFEQDMGTYTLLRNSPHPIRNILLAKMLFRFTITAAIILLLSLYGMAVTGKEVTGSLLPLLLWITVLLLYSLLWHSLLLFINTLRKSTAFNAIAALATWIGLLIIIPATLNLYINNHNPPDALKLAGLMRSRNMPETDEAMHTTLDSFYHYYPSLQPAGKPNPYFYYQGYSAFIWLNDRQSKKITDHFYQAAMDNNLFVQRFACINPAVLTQWLLNTVAATGMEREMEFKQAVSNFHGQIFWFSNTPLFSNQLLTPTHYQRQPVFHFPPPVIPARQIGNNMLLLLITSLLLLVASLFRLQENKLYQ